MVVAPFASLAVEHYRWADSKPNWVMSLRLHNYLSDLCILCLLFQTNQGNPDNGVFPVMVHAEFLFYPALVRPYK